MLSLHAEGLKCAIEGLYEDPGQSHQLPLNCFNEQGEAAKPGVKDQYNSILINWGKTFITEESTLGLQRKSLMPQDEHQPPLDTVHEHELHYK